MRSRSCSSTASAPTKGVASAARPFRQERHAIAFDYPGYGDSDPAPEGTTRDDYAIAILAAMDALGGPRAHICGLSLGGVVAIAIYHSAARTAALR